MKTIPKKAIQYWYKEEYSKKTDSSVYDKPVKALLHFFDVLDKDKKVKKVLELGCGDGRNLFELAKRRYQVTGVDLFGKEQIERHEKRLGLIVNFVKGDATTFKFEKEKYGAIISSEVFHLMSRKDVEEVIRRMQLATKENGYIYISILSNLKRHFIETKEEFIYEDQSDYTEEEAEKLLQSMFKDWKIIKLDTFHDEQDWPVKNGNYPIDRYHWSGDYVYLIAQRP